LADLRAFPFMLLWFGWLTYWYIAAGDAKGDTRVESPLSRLSHELPLYAGVVVMLLTIGGDGLRSLRFLPQGIGTYGLGLLLTTLGLGLTVWARVHLGVNWSVSVAHKHEHQLVRTGPYARVRHPIYSGLVLAFLGALVARGDLGALLACALGTLSLVMKLRREEHWMHEIFGEAYSEYSTAVPALLPRWW
jgi:protein-S-isoprenylcysteine O-methyltransferase Ste14